MSTFHQFGDQVLITCKGASEAILHVLESSQAQEGISAKSNQWASEGERVLAFAGKLIPSLPAEVEWDSLEKDLSFWGLVGMIDPPREEVKDAIQECKTAGIQPVMITGDHPETAKTIAEQVGILEKGRLSISGSELRELSDEEF